MKKFVLNSLIQHGENCLYQFKMLGKDKAFAQH